MKEHPQWIKDVFASNMAYRMRSAPNFAGDYQHDLRDAMLDHRAGTLAAWAGSAANSYLAATRLLDIRDDPIADSLETFRTFDMACLQLAHDYLAAYWRCHHLAAFRTDKAPFIDVFDDRYSYGFRFQLGTILHGFRSWLMIESGGWARKAPFLIRRICLVLVQQNTASGIMAEIDLMDSLRARYPMPVYSRA